MIPTLQTRRFVHLFLRIILSLTKHYNQEEFEKTITEDLEMMEITGDSLSHSSDYFELLADYGVKIIKAGKAYADDTDGATVRLPFLSFNNHFHLVNV